MRRAQRPFDRMDEAEKAKIATMAARGHSTAHIAAELGRSRAAIQYQRARMGCPEPLSTTRRRPHSIVGGTVVHRFSTEEDAAILDITRNFRGASQTWPRRFGRKREAGALYRRRVILLAEANRTNSNASREG